MKVRTAAIADVTGGAHHGPDVEVDGATIDSRRVRGGELFVPVVGERDGHEFIDDALAAGAAAYLTTRRPTHGTAVEVSDVAGALAALGAWARDRVPDRVVGVTGSVGKTSTKDLLAAALLPRFVTTASPESFNNELGVPLTLLGAPDGVEALVVEMGARGQGHIAQLCAVARPTIGVVTAVAAAHTQFFGDVDAVARAKAELVEALPLEGVAVLNADDERVAAMAERTKADVLTFGSERGDVRALGVGVDDELRPSFTMASPWGTAAVKLAARGEHQVANALAAAAAALSCGVGLDEVVSGLQTAVVSPWRMELRRARSGAWVLNDAYNANPASTRAALRALQRLPARRRIAVLGPMAELGDRADDEHQAVARQAADLGVEVIAVGTPAYGVAPVPDVDGARARLGRLGEGVAVLVKGSRVAGLERLAAALLEASAW